MDYYWDPRREIRELKARVEHAFRCAQQQERVCRPAGAVAVPVDFSVGPDGFHLALDMPGVAREDVELQVERGALVISGNKALPIEADGGSVLRRERSYGAFHRVIPLPDEADLGAVSAQMRQGELLIKVARQAEAPPRRVEISEE